MSFEDTEVEHQERGGELLQELCYPKSSSEEDPVVSEFVNQATAEGFRPVSVEQGRQILSRFKTFLADNLRTSLQNAGWREYAAFKANLTASGLARSAIRCYLSYLTTFYRLRAQASQDPELLDIYHRVKAVGSVRRARGVPWRPLEQDTIRRLLDAVEGEDRVFLLTLLYTGGRAQFYGLLVNDVNFERGEIHAVVKGGKRVAIPLHPALSDVLTEHLRTRGYTSRYLFRHGKNVGTRKGQRANRQNAWRICKRAQRAAGVRESVHPHRFRKTLATWGKRMGLDPQFLQAILAHESVTITLDAYARVEPEDVKRAFAKFDPFADFSNQDQVDLGRAPSLARLRTLSPIGKKEAWDSIMKGLERLVEVDPFSLEHAG